MQRLFGTSVRSGVGLGMAVTLRPGAPPPAPPARQAAQLLRDPSGATVDRVDVVLVSTEYALAAATPLPWARVTAMVGEAGHAGGALSAAPAVTGVAGAMAAVPDGVLVLVDAGRGMVLIDPDAAAVAAFQAARQQIAPRRRVHLEFAHSEPRTLDGRRVRVTAVCDTLEDVCSVVDEGADAVYVPPGAALLKECGRPDRARETLAALADAAGGKPVTLASETADVDIAALLQAAARLDVALAVDLGAGPPAVRDEAERLVATGAALLADDVEYGDVLLAGRAAPGVIVGADLGAYGVARVVVDPAVSGDTAAFEWLARLHEAAGPVLVPVEVRLGGTDRASVEHAIGGGAAALLVPPGAVQAVKDLARSTDASGGAG